MESLSTSEDRPPVYFYLYLLSALAGAMVLFYPMGAFTIPGVGTGYSAFPIPLFISTGEVVVISIGFLMVCVATIKAYWRNQVRWIPIIGGVLLLIEYSNVLLFGFKPSFLLTLVAGISSFRHTRSEYALLVSGVLALAGAVFPPEEDNFLFL